MTGNTIAQATERDATRDTEQATKQATEQAAERDVERDADRDTEACNIQLITARAERLLRKDGFQIFATMMMSDQEGLPYDQFVDLWESMHKSSERGILYCVPQENYIECLYPHNIIGQYYCIDRKPSFFSQIDEPLLQVKHASGRSVAIIQRESVKAERVYCKPRLVKLIEKRVFLFNNRAQYELLKVAQGASAEDACEQELSFVVRLHQQIACMDREAFVKPDVCLKYCREFYLRSVSLLGQGPHPTLCRRSFKKDTRLRLSGCVEELQSQKES